MRNPILLLLFSVTLAFTSDIDLLYDDSQVAIINIQMAPEDLIWMYDHPESDSIHPASLHFINAFINEQVEDVGIRIRGNTSRGARKKSLKLSFNSFVQGRKFYSAEKLDLKGEHNDPSIMRSKLVWNLYEKTGLATSRAAHCAVYINNIYYGLYLSVEHIDEEFVKREFSDDSGNLWKCLWPADLTYRGPDAEDYHPYFEDDRPYELKTNTDSYDYSKLAQLIDVINNAPNEGFADSLEQVLVVPEVLKYAAMNVITGNWDDYWFLKNNYYLYHEPAIDRFHWIPYDYDNSLGIDWFNVEWTAVNPYEFMTIEESQGQEPGARPLMERIMEQPRYRDLYSHFLTFFQANVTSLEQWEPHMDAIHELITPYALADTFRTLDYGFDEADFTESYGEGPYSYLHVKRGIKEFSQLRTISLQTQMDWEDEPPIIYDIKTWPEHIGPDDSIYVEVSAFSHIGLDSLTIAFHPGVLTVVLSYPMTPNPVEGTTIVELSDRWTGVIPPMGENGTGRMQIGAVDMVGQSAIYPAGRFIEFEVQSTPTPPLRINEIMAINDDAYQDEAGEYDDWIEIYNSAETDTYLSGLYLTDNPNNLTKWQFPHGGNYLPPGGYRVVWCDEDQEQGSDHTNFKLSGSGEFLALVDIDGETIIDLLNFGPQTADVSYGRTWDGGPEWDYFSQPTPGTSNSPSSITDPLVPESFLMRAFPNPFNAMTNITISGLDPGSYEVLIYDLRGALVWQYDGTAEGSPSTTISWQGENRGGEILSGGVYFVKLIQLNEQSHTKLLMLK